MHITMDAGLGVLHAGTSCCVRYIAWSTLSATSVENGYRRRSGFGATATAVEAISSRGPTGS